MENSPAVPVRSHTLCVALTMAPAIPALEESSRVSLISPPNIGVRRARRRQYGEQEHRFLKSSCPSVVSHDVGGRGLRGSEAN